MKNMLFGFESEIVLYCGKKENAQQRRTNFLLKLENDIGIKFSRNNFDQFSDFTFNKSAKNFKEGIWFADYDGSIEPTRNLKSSFFSKKLEWIGVEIVSAPMEYDDFLETIRKLFEFYEKNDVETNFSTGFHISISFKNRDIMKNVDFFKLLLFLDEQDIKKQFPRQDKISSRDLALRLPSLIESLVERDGDDFEKIINFMNNQIRRQINANGIVTFKNKTRVSGSVKGFTVSFGKVDMKGYIEFRMIGGENYHKRYNNIKHILDRYVEVLKISSNFNKYKKEYNKKIEKLLLTT